LSKNKLKKFAELETFERVFQPEFDAIFEKDFYLKGKWVESVFLNTNPLVLELGCGKGEYTVGMAQRFLEKNFLGVDIKGARIWKGARAINEQDIRNAAFLRTRIEFIASFFGKEEVDEIWITFPDPQLKRRRNKKRLTGSVFLNKYRNFLKDGGLIHLKTDNDVLYEYTKELAEYNGLEIVVATGDLYATETGNDILGIKTHYENLFLREGSNINYICFRLPSDRDISEPPYHEE